MNKADYRAYLIEQAAGFGIPSRMTDGLVSYIVDGQRPGGFLEAVLSNDLNAAVARGDDENRKLLSNYILFLFNRAPGGCWGNRDLFESWEGMNLEEGEDD